VIALAEGVESTAKELSQQIHVKVITKEEGRTVMEMVIRRGGQPPDTQVVRGGGAYGFKAPAEYHDRPVKLFNC
jgi:hypothetical protein